MSNYTLKYSAVTKFCLWVQLELSPERVLNVILQTWVVTYLL